MVTTPWFDRQIPFNQAAEIGTKKVIDEHSTIGIVVTTDGSICDIPRGEYIEAEERVIGDLKKIDKPFIIILNSVDPRSDRTEQLRAELENKYNVQCIAVNCLQMDEQDIRKIIESVLFEFPVTEIGIMMPAWFDALDNTHWLKNQMFEQIGSAFQSKRRVFEIPEAVSMISNSEHVSEARVDSIKLATGSVMATVRFNDEMFIK
jgi:stage IV sporulation protein A